MCSRLICCSTSEIYAHDVSHKYALYILNCCASNWGSHRGYEIGKCLLSTGNTRPSPPPFLDLVITKLKSILQNSISTRHKFLEKTPVVAQNPRVDGAEAHLGSGSSQQLVEPVGAPAFQKTYALFTLSSALGSNI
jgi:hypothetical protein